METYLIKTTYGANGTYVTAQFMADSPEMARKKLREHVTAIRKRQRAALSGNPPIADGRMPDYMRTDLTCAELLDGASNVIDTWHAWR